MLSRNYSAHCYDDGENVHYYALSGYATVLCFASVNSYVQLNASNEGIITSLFTELSNDPYYPNTASYNRYSSVIFSPYHRDFQNCIKIEGKNDWSVLNYTEITKAHDNIVLLYLKEGKTAITKRGYPCRKVEDVTNLPKVNVRPNKTMLQNFLLKINNSLNNNPYGKAELIKSVFNEFGCGAVLDEEILKRKLTPQALDPRNTKDYTRRNGLNGKCAESACDKYGYFTDYNSGERTKVTDYEYEGDFIYNVANSVILSCPPAQ